MKIFKLWLPVLIWAGIIFWLSGIPNLKSNFEYDFILRKMAHAVEYFILTFLLYRAFKGSFNINISYLFIYPATLSLIYAVSDEFHQSFIPGRSPSIRDVLIDAIGILAFYIVIKIFAVNQRISGSHK
jgi:VanZ family protein